MSNHYAVHTHTHKTKPKKKVKPLLYRRSEQTSLLLMVQESPPASAYFQHWANLVFRAVALGDIVDQAE